MRKLLTSVFLFFSAAISLAQPTLDNLTVEKIMRDPKWIGTSPSNVYWSADGNSLYFNWNPDSATSDSVYFITLSNHNPVKASFQQKQNIVPDYNASWNTNRTGSVFTKDGDIFFKDLKTGVTKRIIQTTENETNPVFSFDDKKIVYTSGLNLYAWDIESGETTQLTNLESKDPEKKPTVTTEEQWLKNDQLQYLKVLKERKEKKDATDAYNKKLSPKELRFINIEERVLQGLTVSPDGRFVSYRLTKTSSDAKATIVPNYVTESGFSSDIRGRTKVGEPQNSSEFFIYDRKNDTVLAIKTDSIPGISDLPDYVKDYPKKFEQQIKEPPVRRVIIGDISWSPHSAHAILDIRSQDNKDRWLMMFEPSASKLKLIDRQRDEAWIGGPGTGGFSGVNSGWINENTFWFQSEITGYSHLYTVNVQNGEKKALTSGRYEVQQAELSKDK
ncbi:MAG TPA: DPP IV N-terminal domain-containing protein, partial [Chitinophagaceae bacterium]|nr:DPP IV N-terminal domain-containing protein [Chitinophagaceae bacterium]